jgi:hypothetical protein
LWLPRANQYFHIDELPVLGTGKLDLRAIKQAALDLSKKSPTPDETPASPKAAADPSVAE